MTRPSATEQQCEAWIQRDAKNPMSFEQCTRKAKGKKNGKPMCGIHLRSKNQ